MPSEPEASSAPPVATGTTRIVADGEPLPPFDVSQQDVSKSGRKPLPHELYAARVAVVAALKTQGYTRKQIAEALQMTQAGVHWCIRRARQEKLVIDGMAETVALIEDEALPLAVEALLKDLRKGDQTAYLETLKGRGIFKSFSNNKNEGGGTTAPMAFQFNFITPDGAKLEAPAIPVLNGQVFGVEREE